MIAKYVILIILSLLITGNCTNNTEVPVSPLVNTAHLDHLYQEITIQGGKMAIIHIYSDYPDYNWVEAEGEGIACVDDAARAAIFYLEQYKITGNREYWKRVKNLIHFLQYMQAENGCFYNFIKTDYSINTTHKTSTALPTWWTWRALWALSETTLFMEYRDSLDKKHLQSSMTQSVRQLFLRQPDTTKLKTTAGFNLPTWLPYETGADQAAVMILFLVNYYKLTGAHEVLPYIKGLCTGIVRMQQGDKNNFPYFAFLSWENTWHGWGNAQSYALLQAYSITADRTLLTAALHEIDHFYLYLHQNQFLSVFSLRKEGEIIHILSKQQFSQIAYGVRPMVWACLQAGMITGDTCYYEQAAQLSGWFFGDNPAKKQMYDFHTGRCFDGIESSQKINTNSGAESTIEALLTLIRIEQNPVARRHLVEYLSAGSR
jgi:uncharacterized protein YyaL (SSP411 family)